MDYLDAPEPTPQSPIPAAYVDDIPDDQADTPPAVLPLGTGTRQYTYDPRTPSFVWCPQGCGALVCVRVLHPSVHKQPPWIEVLAHPVTPVLGLPHACPPPAPAADTPAAGSYPVWRE